MNIRSLTRILQIGLALMLGLSVKGVLAQTVKVSPGVAPPTLTVTASGSGFTARSLVDIYFDVIDRCLTITNSAGGFSCSFKIPAKAEPGQHWITAVERRNASAAQTRFRVRTDWAQFRFSPTHKGRNAYENILTPVTAANLDLAWSASAGTNAFSSVAVWSGRAYAAAADGRLSAFDALTGTLKWSSPTGARVFLTNACPAVMNGVVYVWNDEMPPTAGGGIFAFNAYTGAPLWKGVIGAFGSAPTVTKAGVYVNANVGNSGGVRALKPNDGTQLWQYRELGVLYDSPAVSNGVLYVASSVNNGQTGYMYAFDALTGEQIWRQPVNSPFMTDSSPAVSGGVVYIGSADGDVHAFRVADGKPLWTAATGGTRIDSSVAVGDGRVYAAANDGSVRAFSAWNGKPLWVAAIGAGSIYSSPALANGVVYIGVDESVYALDANDGSVLWNYPTGGTVGASPAVADGTVYIASADGRVYAFDLSARDFKASQTRSGASVRRPKATELRPDATLIPIPSK